MKRIVYPLTKTFRTTEAFSRELTLMANRLNRHESDLIRLAVEGFIASQHEPPDKSVRVA